jgi:thiamine transport system permease protein
MAHLAPSRIKTWAQTLFSIPSGVPSVVAGMAWILCLGRAGVLANWGIHSHWAYSLKAVVLAHVFYNAPWIALGVCRARESISPELLAAARTLGAGRIASFRYVVGPLLFPALSGVVTQAFTWCSMSFALVLILGGGPPVQTLETEIYGHIRYGALDLPGALTFAIWQLGLTMIPWCIILLGLSKPIRLEGKTESGAAVRRTLGFRTRISATLLLLCGVILIFPYGVILMQTSFRELLRVDSHLLLRPLGVSVQIALATATLSVTTALALLLSLLAWRRYVLFSKLLTGLAIIPGGVSALVLGLGIWFAYGAWIDPFSGSLAAMILLQTVLFLPVSFRLLWPLLYEIRTTEWEAATSLGASPLRALMALEWRPWRAPLMAAFAVTAGASLGEVAAVSLFYGERIMPLPLLISRWMQDYRFAEAQGVAVLLFLLSSLIIVGSRYVVVRKSFRFP